MYNNYLAGKAKQSQVLYQHKVMRTKKLVIVLPALRGNGRNRLHNLLKDTMTWNGRDARYETNLDQLETICKLMNDEYYGNVRFSDGVKEMMK